MKSDRLFQIIYLLLQNEKITANELAKRLEVSTRTIYRDIDTLSALDIPIFSLSGKKGGISLLKDFTLNKSLLSPREQDEIIFALQSFKATKENSTFLLNKLTGLFNKEEPNWIEVDFSRWGRKEGEKEKFNILKKAILEKG